MAADIDWEKGYIFLDKELYTITKDAAASTRTVDKLVKVFKKGGEEIWVLVHIEIQGKAEDRFSKQMYTYQYRLFNRYRVPIASIAILIDTDPD